ncbi:hypothetical protein LJR117_005349 [Acidovorax sp. LjRoot117]
MDAMLVRTLLFSVALLAGCSTTTETVHVQILPTEYRAGDVASALVTPVVDEVVRLRPDKVHLSMCRSTPNAKVLQFNTELQARSGAKVTAGFYDACPES